MSDVFDRALIAASDSFFKLPGAETVIYIPKSGSPRRIKAVISRNEAEQMPGIDGGSVPKFEVLVKNHETEGIASDELDTGGDKIEMGPRVDNIPRSLRLSILLNHDAGMCLIGVF